MTLMITTHLDITKSKYVQRVKMVKWVFKHTEFVRYFFVRPKIKWKEFFHRRDSYITFSQPKQELTHIVRFVLNMTISEPLIFLSQYEVWESCQRLP